MCGIVGPMFGWKHTIIFLLSEQYTDRCVSVDSSVVKKFLFPLLPSLSALPLSEFTESAAVQRVRL